MTIGTAVLIVGGVASVAIAGAIIAGAEITKPKPQKNQNPFAGAGGLVQFAGVALDALTGGWFGNLFGANTL